MWLLCQGGGDRGGRARLQPEAAQGGQDGGQGAAPRPALLAQLGRVGQVQFAQAPQARPRGAQQHARVRLREADAQPLQPCETQAL